MAYQLREQTVSVVRKLRQDNPLKKFGLGAEDEARLVGHLLTVHEAPGSIPSTEETGDPRNPSTWNSSTSKVKSGGSGVLSCIASSTPAWDPRDSVSKQTNKPNQNKK